jgi:hypothetical protein
LEAGRNGEKGRVGARVYFAVEPAEGYINYTTAQKCRIIVYKLAIDSFYKLEFFTAVCFQADELFSS